MSEVETRSLEAALEAMNAECERAIIRRGIKRLAKPAAIHDAARAESAVRAEGHEIGMEWAAGEAAREELVRLAGSVESWDGEIERYATEERWASNLAASEHVAQDIYGDDASDFWESVLGEENAGRIGEPPYLIGFVAGALKVWRGVLAHEAE